MSRRPHGQCSPTSFTGAKRVHRHGANAPSSSRKPPDCPSHPVAPSSDYGDGNPPMARGNTARIAACVCTRGVRLISAFYLALPVGA